MVVLEMRKGEMPTKLRRIIRECWVELNPRAHFSC